MSCIYSQKAMQSQLHVGNRNNLNKMPIQHTYSAMPIHYLCIVAASSLRWVQQVTSATDSIHGTTQGVRIILVVIVAHDVLHGFHIHHLLHMHAGNSHWQFCDYNVDTTCTIILYLIKSPSKVPL